MTLICCWSHGPQVQRLHLTLIGLADNVIAGVTQGSVTQNTVQSEHTPAVKRLNSYRAVPWWESKKAGVQSIWYPWHLTWTFLFNFRNLGLSHQGAVGEKHFETSQRSSKKLRKEETLHSCYYGATKHRENRPWNPLVVTTKLQTEHKANLIVD